MASNSVLHYLFNGFLFLIPVLLWNVFFAKALPVKYRREYFWKDIPKVVGVTENILRLVVIFLPLLFPIELEKPIQKTGLIVYVFGMIIYFLSWVLQMAFPKIIFSKSRIGFLAPAYTTIIWFTGIGLMCQAPYFKISYHYSFYLILSLVFVLFHTIHAGIVFSRR